jgi:hypothetical protein
MGRFAIQAGGHFDTVTPHELDHALRDQDVRLRADLSGVKWGELFINSAVIGSGVQLFTSSGAMSQTPGAGFLWAVMSVGLELSVASQVRLYKGSPAFSGPGTTAPVGNGRLVTTMSNFITPSAQLSKGQFTLKANDQFTLFMVTAGSILSVYLAYIEVPIEQQGKLWL